MTLDFQHVFLFLCALGMIGGIKLMSSPTSAVQGNLLGAVSMLGAIMATLIANEAISPTLLLIALVIGGAIGFSMAIRVAMIQMPQFVALLNGFGGGASALVAFVVLFDSAVPADGLTIFTSSLAILIGGMTLSGSAIAAGKLDGRLAQSPLQLPYHSLLSVTLLAISGILVVASITVSPLSLLPVALLLAGSALVFGGVFTLRVGGADMPVTISLLNSFSGLAASIAGFTLKSPLLVVVGAVVGAAGVILTQIMCKAMNRSLWQVLAGDIAKSSRKPSKTPEKSFDEVLHNVKQRTSSKDSLASQLTQAQQIVIIPGYGMAVAQAQSLVKELMEKLEAAGKDVKVAIHPVAGRMPGHMNVLLAEVDVSYDKLYEMDVINEQFSETDLVIVVGANDVINPAAIDGEDTPIHGMPILRADQASKVIICNYDTKPGYSGVPNPLYERDNVTLMLGDAKNALAELLDLLENKPRKQGSLLSQVPTQGQSLATAQSVVIVPGYGMAVAQAQSLVKDLMDKLESAGKDVKVAIHPVAGRMPGHMNVLLAEVDVSYDKLYEMDVINEQFSKTDLVIVVGANDVVNPAAIDQEDTPIYGMPILRAYQANKLIICNYDTKPGYSGVPNPLYEQENVSLMLGDAKDTLSDLLKLLENEQEQQENPISEGTNRGQLLSTAQSVVIVPGYGMAVAQAQSDVKDLMDKLESAGKDVKVAIHPVAGRMPGHMNVLLAEVDVSYDKLYEMDVINEQFSKTDLVIVVGANDVVNPAAIDQEDTPIYGMPILKAYQAKQVIICNYDTKPGYSGVANPLYDQGNVSLMLGDASTTVKQLIVEMGDLKRQEVAVSQEISDSPAQLATAALATAQTVIIVPGYGMAVAQAQQHVKNLIEHLEAQGKQVKVAIHPVAGRMPGHMNVLLAEVDVSYEKLYEMDVINEQFLKTDLVIVVGANDVVNPAAIDQDDTPIYGMPILKAYQAKQVIICNYDTKPGYSGVANPLYQADNSILVLGDAAITVASLYAKERQAS